MAVYFDTKVRTDHLGTNTGIYFHDVHPLLALTSYNQGIGGSVNLYNRDVSSWWSWLGFGSPQVGFAEH